jgi:hypothetical protein
MKHGMEKSMRQIVSRAAAPDFIKLAAKAAVCAGALALCGTNALAQAVTPDQATRMYNRIAGIPPTAGELAQMLAATSPVNAALVATNDAKFYNDTIRNMAAPWTNRSQSVFVPLNDYTATVIGMVRDNVPFNTVLSADILYIGDGTSGEGAYSPDNNTMYQNLDDAIRGNRNSVGGNGGHHHHARCSKRVLRQRHESRDVPLHHDQSPLQ